MLFTSMKRVILDKQAANLLHQVLSMVIKQVNQLLMINNTHTASKFRVNSHIQSQLHQSQSNPRTKTDPSSFSSIQQPQTKLILQNQADPNSKTSSIQQTAQAHTKSSPELP
ncbi:hypothetical protein Droror1_Dr00019753 [Drosera rotundifolia]